MKDKKVIIEELNRIKNLMGYDRSRTLNENTKTNKKLNEQEGYEGYADILKSLDSDSGVNVYGTSDGKPRRFRTPDGDIFDSAVDKGKTPKGSKWINKPEKVIDAVKDVASNKNVQTATNTVGGGKVVKSVTGVGKNVASSAEVAGAESAVGAEVAGAEVAVGAEVAGAEAAAVGAEAAAVGAETAAVVGAETAAVVGAETAAVVGAETAAVVGAEAAVGAGAAAAVGGGEAAAAAATFLGLGPVGWAIIGVASIAALGVWAYTKDDKMGMVEKLFDICQSSSNKDKWKRYMSDIEVKKNSGILYHAMEGLGTDEEAVYGVFKSFKSPGDFCAVGEKYENTFGESLLEALNGDFDYGWEGIAEPLVDMTKKYAQTESEEYCKDHVEECAENLKKYCKKIPNDPKCNVLKSEDLLVRAKKCGHKSVEDYKNSDWKCDSGSSGGGNVGTGKSEYVNCNGEYHKGCKGPRIVQLQRCLGVGVDGKFGEETEKALEEKTDSKTFNDEDVKKICGKK